MKPPNSSFGKPLPTILPRAERRPVSELVAYHWTGPGPKQEGIRNISSSGVYLLTDERWLPGAVVPLTLQRDGPPEESTERRITLQTIVVRWGEDGVGLSFVLLKHADSRLWESPLDSAADQTEPEGILREFRMAEALAFLSRICPSTAEGLRRLLREGLSNIRVASAVEIALKAEKLLESGPDAGRMCAHPHLVERIFEDGSRAENDVARQLWAGLLATSCTIEGNDESNLVFIDLLSQLASVHVQILAAACTRATKVVSGFGSISSKPLACTISEIKQITGLHDFLRVERELQHLTDLGLLENKLKSSFFLPMDEVHITPTGLALQLYARCHDRQKS